MDHTSILHSLYIHPGIANFNCYIGVDLCQALQQDFFQQHHTQLPSSPHNTVQIATKTRSRENGSSSIGIRTGIKRTHEGTYCEEEAQTWKDDIIAKGSRQSE